MSAARQRPTSALTWGKCVRRSCQRAAVRTPARTLVARSLFCALAALFSDGLAQEEFDLSVEAAEHRWTSKRMTSGAVYRVRSLTDPLPAAQGRFGVFSPGGARVSPSLGGACLAAGGQGRSVWTWASPTCTRRGAGAGCSALANRITRRSRAREVLVTVRVVAARLRGRGA